MKYPVFAYAESLSELLVEASSLSSREKIAENFYEFLRRNGDNKKMGSILRMTEKLIRQKNGETKVLVESADLLSKTEREKIKKAFSGKIIFEEKNDETLLAGNRIIIDDEILIDTTARKEISMLLSKNK